MRLTHIFGYAIIVLQSVIFGGKLMDNRDKIMENISSSSPEQPSCNLSKEEELTADSASSPNFDEHGAEDCGSEDDLSLSGWLWRLCIPVIPCIGVLIFLAMLCFWSFGSKPAPSYFRTWAKAALIATTLQIAFILVILLAVQLSGMDIIGLVMTFIRKAF